MTIAAEHTAGAAGDLPEGLTFRHGGPGDLPEEWPYRCLPSEHEIRAEIDGKAIGQIRWVSEVGPNARVSPGYITFAGVQGQYQRRGIASEMLRRAREIDPRVHHADHLTGDGKAWSQHTAGPAGDHIPERFRSPVPPSPHELHEGRPVVLDRPAEQDLAHLPADVKKRLLAALDAIEEGKANLEAKTRDLTGVFSVRLTNSWRALLYFGREKFWHLFGIVDHDYSEVSRRWASVQIEAAISTTARENDTSRYLDMTNSMWHSIGAPEGSMYRSVDQIIRDRGKAWPNVSKTLPPGVKRGPMGNCFGNALDAIIANPHLIYVEGYANSGYFPMQHAWLVDGEGTVYDPTWEDGSDYFGVAFDSTWLRRYVVRSGYTSVFGTDFFHDGLLELLRKGLPDQAINSTGKVAANVPEPGRFRDYEPFRKAGDDDDFHAYQRDKTRHMVQTGQAFSSKEYCPDCGRETTHDHTVMWDDSIRSVCQRCGKFNETVWPERNMRRMSQKTSMPSWRDRGAHPAAEAIIAPDTGRSRRNSFSVYLYGQPHARRSSLAEAKQTVEEIYGPLDWQRIAGDKDPHFDRVWGDTTAFNDAKVFHIVERLPRLGTTAAVDGARVSGIGLRAEASYGGEVWYHACSPRRRAEVESLGHFPANYYPMAQMWGRGVYLTTKPGASTFGADVVRVEPAWRNPYVMHGAATTFSDVTRTFTGQMAKDWEKVWKRAQNGDDDDDFSDIISEGFRGLLLDHGYDGLVMPQRDGEQWGVVFEPTDAKVVTMDRAAALIREASTPFLHLVTDPAIDTKPMTGFEDKASYDWIHPQIATGGAIRYATDLRQLQRKGITAIVSGRRDFEDSLLTEGREMGIQFLTNPTPDNGERKPTEWFKRAIDFCLPVLRRGQRVYVHCHAGMNRGPSLAYAVLRAYTGCSHEQAMREIQSARPYAPVAYADDADAALMELGYVHERSDVDTKPFLTLTGAAASDVWYHGCSMRRAEEVSRVGFTADYRPTLGNYGMGLYLTSSPKTANNFGDMVTREQGRPGAMVTLTAHPKKVFEAKSVDLQQRLNELAGSTKVRESAEISDLLAEHGYDALLVHFFSEDWLVLLDPTAASYRGYIPSVPRKEFAGRVAKITSGWYHACSPRRKAEVEARGSFPADYSPKDANWGPGVYLINDDAPSIFGKAVVRVEPQWKNPLVVPFNSTNNIAAVVDRHFTPEMQAEFAPIMQKWRRNTWSVELPEEFAKILVKHGYDGIILKRAGGEDWAVVFDPTKAKVVAPPTIEQAAAKIEGALNKTSGVKMWHGSPSGDMRGGPYGLHVGSQEAARQALEARIGRRADGKDWDGTQEYGKTLLMGKDAIRNARRHPYCTGYNCGAPNEDHYPLGTATYGDGSKVPMTAKPDLFEVEIIGEMGNTPADPRSDSAANANMKRQVTQGRARKGYFYTNIGEDAGSISAVVPGLDWVRRTGKHGAMTKQAAAGWLYHCSRQVNRESIREHGLQTGIGESPWKTYDWLKFTPGTYVFDNIEDARLYVKTMSMSTTQDNRWDIWKINGVDVDVQPDPLPGIKSYIQGESGLVLEPIPPKRIGLVESYDAYHKVAAAKIAEALGTTTLWRGLRVNVPGQPSDYANPKAWWDAVMTAVRSEGLGSHWTSSKRVAEWFARDNRNSGDTGFSYDTGRRTSVAVVFEAEVDPVRIALPEAQYDNGGLVPGEREQFLDPGTPVHITRMWLALPEGEGQRTPAGDTKRPLGDWREFPVDQHRTAAMDALDEHWRPTKGMFAPGMSTLDPRIFDTTTNRMLPQVQTTIMGTLDAFWTPRYGDWRNWARVYLAGSGASYWWDSDADMDILIGVDLDRLRAARPANKEVSDEDITAHLNRELTDDLRPTTTHMLGFEATWFINPGAFDITAIHPYAAYDVGSDEWIQHPPVLPADWGPSSIPEETWRRCEQIAREAEEVLSLPEPDRTTAGTVLFNWIHEGRRAAYSANGGGWLDPGNVAYQYLSQHPRHLLRQLYLCKHPEAATAAEGLEKTASRANDPEIAHARETGQKMVLYRGEGSHERQSYYPKGSTEAGGWWTSDRQSAEQYARSTEQGQVYRIEVDPDEVDPRGLPGYFFIADPKVRERRTLGSKTAASEEWRNIPGLEFRARGCMVTATSPEADAAGQVAGKISWYKDGEVWFAVVFEKYRRMGLATELFRRAKEFNPKVHHSDVLTEDGKAWSQTVSAKTAAPIEEIPGLVIEQEWDLPGVADDSEEVVTARINGKLVGGLVWRRRDGLINYVQVDADQRRKGIATRLLAKAREVEPRLHHDTEEHQSELGKAWVRAVGTKTAERTPGGPIEWLVRVEFGRRRPDAQPTETTVQPAYLDVDAGERYVWVVAETEAEAKTKAAEMVASGSDDARNPIAHTGDMPTKAEVIRVRAAKTADFEESEHPRADDGRFTRKGPNFDRDAQDKYLAEQFGPNVKDTRTMKHPKSGWNLPIGKEYRVFQPKEGEGPAVFSVKDYGEDLDDPKQRWGMGTDAGTEPIRYAYRGMSRAEYEQAMERGHFGSDKRGVLADWEGTNAAVDPQTAAYYLATNHDSADGGYLVKFKVHPDRKWFTIPHDDYLRTRENIPLEDVEKAIPLGNDGRALYPVTGRLAHTAAMFGYDDGDMEYFVKEYGHEQVRVMHRNYDDAFLATVHGIPVGQLTYVHKNDESVFSDDDEVAEKSKGDYNGHYVEIDALAVDKHWRRRGVGTALLKAFIEWADKTYGFLGKPEERKGWGPGSFTSDGAAMWKAVMHETVPATQRIHYGQLLGRHQPRTAALGQWDVRATGEHAREFPGSFIYSMPGVQLWYSKSAAFPGAEALVIHAIFVEPSMRRQGLATMVLDEMAEEFYDHVCDPGGLTEDGKPLWESWVAKHGWPQLPGSDIVFLGDRATLKQKLKAARPHMAAKQIEAAVTGTFWRVHPEGRAFGDWDATSKPFFNQPDAEPQRGYSCFENPWHLYLYVAIQWGRLYDGNTVLRFPGERVGTGHDGEDLAVPTGLPFRTTWGDFCRMLPEFPLPASPVFAPWVAGRKEYGSWKALAQHWKWLDLGEPEKDFVVHKVLRSRTAGKEAAKPLPAGYTLEYTPAGNTRNASVAAIFDGKVVGAIQWKPEREVWGGRWNADHTAIEEVLVKRPPQIVDLKVQPEHQRKGLATAMYEEAKRHEPNLVHDDIVLPDGQSWMKSLGNMGYYAKEWRWQAWAERTAPGLMAKERLPSLRKYVKAVLDDYGVTAPLEISVGTAGLGYSEGGLIDGKAHIVINPDEKNLWNALHEAAHVVCQHQGMDEFDNDHGPGFRRVFSEILQVHGGVDVDLERNPGQRTAQLAALAGNPANMGTVTAKEYIDMTPPTPEGWEGDGIYEMDLSGVSSTGCVALMGWIMGMAFPFGFLTWDKDKHTIEGVFVNEDYRGKGIATHLLQEAEKVAGTKLLDSGEYTPEGLAWAKKRGLNPKLKKRVPKEDMARMRAQLNNELMGGHRIKRLLMKVG